LTSIKKRRPFSTAKYAEYANPEPRLSEEEGKKGIGTPPPPEKSGERTGKKTCKPPEQAENHEKGPRCSWARNQMGNSS
jgi:hypothetical protein